MNHYKHNVDVTQDPYYCTDCELHLADDGTELDADNLEQDWYNALGAPAEKAYLNRKRG